MSVPVSSTQKRPVPPRQNTEGNGTNPSKVIRTSENPKASKVKKPSIKDTLLSQLEPNKNNTKLTTNVNRRGVGAPPVIQCSSAVNKLKEYEEKYSRLLKLELEDELSQVENRIKTWTKQRLVSEGICLTNMKCEIARSFVIGSITLRFSCDKPILNSRFNHGDMVLLSRDDNINNSTSGVVLDRHPYGIQITVHDIPDRCEQSFWRIDKGANRVSFDRMISAIKLFISYADSNCDIRGLITGSDVANIAESASKPPQFSTPAAAPGKVAPIRKQLDFNKLPSLEDLLLNQSQQLAITSGLKSKLTLIQGPPGTGKTRTAVLLLRKIIEFHSPNSPLILASADTNVAVDNLLEGLLDEGIRAIRVGQPVKVRKSLREHTLHSLTENHVDAKGLSEEKDAFHQLAKKLSETDDPEEVSKLQVMMKASQAKAEKIELEIVKKVLKNAQVICSTCIGSGHELLAAMSFPIVLVDEATQATEPSVLVPLVHKSKQVILLGDHFQLPPTVISTRAAKEGLSMSLFQRLAESGLQPCLLNIQYRMHPSLSYFPNTAFYYGKVTDGIAAASRPTPNGFPFPNPIHPVAFRACFGLEETTADGSKINKHDAAIVARIVRDLLCANGAIRGSELGVISPYSGQVRLLQKEFDLLGGIASDVDINSVDGYQGREKEVIVFSTVRSNEEGKVGFLSDWRRLNVALTRARRGIIVVGNPNTLKNDEHWGRYLDWINSSKLMVTENYFYTGPASKPIPSNQVQVQEVQEVQVQEEVREEVQEIQKIQEIQVQDQTPTSTPLPPSIESNLDGNEIQNPSQDIVMILNKIAENGEISTSDDRINEKQPETEQNPTTS
eukprot:TRINITY_DN4689_c0_g1_i1.p1 TRINITY_DN4689_c0_g1~~TRINITY_DN4689_c0_g1_i1.p1  ORF type:complete len:842 (-),score=197.24 TRINITY_DN4689_c0_g1_i1:65-2590(-)